VKIGVGIVRHGRCMLFQVVEVAVPRSLFADILRRIDLAQAKTDAIHSMNGNFNVSSDPVGEVCPRPHKFAMKQARSRLPMPRHDAAAAAVRGPCGLPHASNKSILVSQPSLSGRCRIRER